MGQPEERGGEQHSSEIRRLRRQRSKAEPNRQSWQAVPWQCKLRTQSVFALHVELAHARDILFHSHPHCG